MNVRSDGKKYQGKLIHMANRRLGKTGTTINIMSMCKMKGNNVQSASSQQQKCNTILYGNNSQRTQSRRKHYLRNWRKRPCVFHDMEKLKQIVSSIKLAQYWGNKIIEMKWKEKQKNNETPNAIADFIK